VCQQKKPTDKNKKRVRRFPKHRGVNIAYVANWLMKVVFMCCSGC